MTTCSEHLIYPVYYTLMRGKNIKGCYDIMISLSFQFEVLKVKDELASITVINPLFTTLFASFNSVCNNVVKYIEPTSDPPGMFSCSFCTIPLLI